MAKQLNVNLAVTANTTQAKAQLQQLQQSLQSLASNSTNLKLGLSSDDVVKASNAALELSAHLKQATNIDTGTLDFTKLNNSILNSGKTLESYGRQLVSLGPQGKQAFVQLATAVAQSEIPMKRISGMLGQMGTVLANTVRWQAASSVIHGVMGAISQAFNYAQSLNQSLNNIQIVTQMSDKQMANFATSANKAAKALSTTTTRYTDAALIYYQQGIRDQRELAQRTDTTIKMANVTGQSAQKVSDQMTSIWNNFADGSTNLEYYADVITALGAATASSSEEISKGLEKFAAIADTVGLSYENATAALATITATTRQSADTVGTGLRTLFSRLQSLSLGETLEDGVNLTKYSKALQTVGVEVLDATGNLRRMDDILLDLGNRWDGLTKAQQTALAQTVGGVRQYTTLVALMDNMDFYKENLEVAKNSEGTLQRQQEIYEKSWKAANDRVRASAESIYSSLINDKFFISLTSGFASFLDIINNIITGLGGVKGMLLGLSGILTRVFSAQATVGVYNFANGIRNMFKTSAQQASDRNNFLAKATSIYMGRDITGDENGLNLSGMSRQQATMAQGFYNQINAQQQFMTAQQYMNPIQRMTAVAAMDQARRSNEELQATQTRNAETTGAIRRLQLQNGFDYNSTANQHYISGLKLAEEVNSEISKLERGEITADQLSNRAKLLIGGTKKQISGLIPEEMRQRAGNYLDLASRRESLASELRSFHWDEKDITRYTDLLARQAAGQLEEKEKTELDKLNQKKQEDALKNISPGMKAAENAVNLFGGAMSGLAASQGLTSFVDILGQAKAGMLDTKDAIQQGASALVQTGLNAGRAWMQFNQVLGPIGATIATIATTALPYIIEGIDKLVTTPKEVLANLHENTEQAANLAQEAKQAYDDLVNGFSGHSSLLDTLDSLTKGTLEFERALLEANDAAYQLISQYNLSDSDWYKDANGVIQFEPQVQERLKTEAFKRQRQAQAESYMAEAIEKDFQTQYQADEAQKVYQKELDKRVQQISKSIQTWEESYLKPNGQGTGLYYSREKIQEYTDGLTKAQALNKLAQDSEGKGNDYGIEDAIGFPPYLLEEYYNFLEERNNKLLELNKDVLLDDSALKAYYQRNKDSFGQSNLDESNFISQVKDGTFESNERLANGTAFANRRALENAILSQTGETSLSTVDNLLVNALSNNDKFLSNTLTAGTTIDNPNQNKIYYDGAAGVGEWLRDFLSGNLNKSSIDLKNELVDLEIYQLKDKYKELGATDEDIKALQETNEYKEALTEGQSGLQQFYANAIIRRKTLQEQVKKEQEIKKTLEENGNSEVWKQLENYTNLTGEELVNLQKSLASIDNEEIKPYAEDIGEQALSEFTQLNSDIIEAAGKGLELTNEQRSALGEELKKGTTETNKVVQSAYTNFRRAYGDSAANWAIQQIVSGGEINQKIAESLSGFEFSGSAIQDLLNIRQGKTTLGKYTDELAQEGFKTIKKAVSGDKGLLEELYNSEDFSNNLKTLQKELQKTGKISAKTLLDMGEDLEAVNNLFEVSDMNAQGLADILTAIEIGDIGIDQVTNSLLSALSTAGALKNVLDEDFNYIDNFQQERSIQDIGRFASNLVKSIDSGFESGAYFDPQTLQAWGELFGRESLGEYRDYFLNSTDKFQTPEEIINGFRERFGAENAALDSITKYNNLAGLFEYYNTTGPLKGKESMFSWDSSTQQVKIDDATLQKYGTMEDFIQGLQENYGVSEQMAKMMAGDLSGYAPAFAEFMSNVAFKEGFSKLFKEIDEEGNVGEDREFVLQKELETFLNSYQDVLSVMEQGELKSLLESTFDINLDDFTGDLTDIDTLLGLIKNKSQNTKILDLPKDFNYSNTDELIDQVGGKEAYGKALGITEGVINTEVIHHNQGIQSWNETKDTYGAVTSLESARKAYMAFGASAETVNANIAAALEDQNSGLNAISMSYTDLEGEIHVITTKNQDFLDQWDGTGNIVDAFEKYVNGLQESVNTAQAIEAAAQPIIQGIQKAFTTPDENANGQNLIQQMVAELSKAKGNITFTTNLSTIEDQAKDLKGGITLSATITNLPEGVTIEYPSGDSASGYNNSKGFAGGKHVNGQYTGLAEVGELGPELWIHDGEPYLAGIHGRTKAYIHPNDQIYTASQTREILRDNPSLQDIPGFLVGYGGGGSRSGSGGSNANANNVKTSKWEPERYHLITRQLKDLEREYDRLSKIKDNAYGTNKLEAIQAEIDATNTLIEGQKELIKEAEDYLNIDTDRLKELLEEDEFQVDENGNLLNFEELQQKYRKAAEESKDEHAQDIWKALNQYEETLDKISEENTKMQDLIYQLTEHRLEVITTKVDLKINFDERDLKLIEYFTEKIDDNIYDTARVLSLAGMSLDKINDKIDTTKLGIDEIFKSMTDTEGNQILDMTLEKFLSLSEAERDALNINSSVGEQLEEYSDNLLDYIKELNDLKTKGIDELSNAFDELNENVSNSIDLFEHYNSILKSLKDIIDLQGITISKDLRDVFQAVNQTLLSNNANNIQAELDRYEKLRDTVADLEEKLLTVTDPILKKEWESQLKEIEDEMRNSQTNLLSLWQNGLDIAKSMFEQSVNNAVTDFEEKISGAYGNLNGLQNAYDRKKELDKFYVDDYEKYYQIAKLQRQINKELDNASKTSYKNTKGLNLLFSELNSAREEGVQLTTYDLDIFEKRYEYEKALMELEDARNAKSTVRLQRDTNGSWGYVYTANEDELAQRQQAIDDALYQWQKATSAEAERLTDDILPKIASSINQLSEAYQNGEDIPEDIINDTIQLMNMAGPQLSKVFEDAAMTVPLAANRYSNELFDIQDNLNETTLRNLLNTQDGITGLMDVFQNYIFDANKQMNNAKLIYQNQISDLNNFFKAYNEDLKDTIESWTEIIKETSDNNKEFAIETIETAKSTFDDILVAVNSFEEKFMAVYEPIIERNEQFINQLNQALDALNRKEFINGELRPYIGSYIDPAQFDKGGYTGSWGHEGRLAILHERENIFDPYDTIRLLDAAKILRTIDMSSYSFAAGMGNLILPGIPFDPEPLEQNVRIEAQFPNVTQHTEIEQAFDNLINMAAQYANRKI